MPLLLALTSCSGLPRACMRSVHTRHRHVSFRAEPSLPRAHLGARSSTVPSRTQTHNKASRPTARAGAGAGALRGPAAGVLPFCCCCGEPPPLPSRQSVPPPPPEDERGSKASLAPPHPSWLMMQAILSPGLGKEHEEEGQNSDACESHRIFGGAERPECKRVAVLRPWLAFGGIRVVVVVALR